MTSRSFRAVLAASVLSLVGLTACVADPTEAGTALGERHVAAIRAETITLDEMADDVDAAKARYEARSEREALLDAYRTALEPVRGEIAALAVEEAAGALGDAARQALGEVRGAVESITKPTEETKEELKETGREVGKAVKGAVSAFEAFLEGVSDGIRDGEED